MDIASLMERLNKIRDVTNNAAGDINAHVAKLEVGLQELAQQTSGHQVDGFVVALTVFMLACFVGYYVVWKVTPALHSPLMSVTNAISSVIVVGAIIAAGPALGGISTSFGFVAVVLASINIFGGFIVTQRMLQMFSKKKGE